MLTNNPTFCRNTSTGKLPFQTRKTKALNLFFMRLPIDHVRRSVEQNIADDEIS